MLFAKLTSFGRNAEFRDPYMSEWRQAGRSKKRTKENGKGRVEKVPRAIIMLRKKELLRKREAAKSQSSEHLGKPHPIPPYILKIGDISDPKQQVQIAEFVRENEKGNTPSGQKAQLLLRNPHFLRERNTVGFPFPERAPEPPLTSQQVLERRDNWVRFCNRWRIDNWWDGRDASLIHHLNVEPEIYYRDLKERRVYVIRERSHNREYCDVRSIERALELPDGGSFILIRINPWTTVKDISRHWPEIECAKEWSFGYSEVQPSTFARSLCWYDLNKKCNINRGKITSFWIKFRPGDIDLTVMKRLLRNKNLGYKNPNELLKEIRTNPSWSGLQTLLRDKDPNELLLKSTTGPSGITLKELLRDKDPKELLMKIRTDSSWIGLKELFDYEREKFLTDLDSNFSRTIKESIRRIEEHINRLTPV